MRICYFSIRYSAFALHDYFFLDFDLTDVEVEVEVGVLLSVVWTRILELTPLLEDIYTEEE